jgi:hypothetical protein
MGSPGSSTAILEADRGAPPKQRHTAKRIFERLRAEHGFAGGYTIVKDYVRERRLRGGRCSSRWPIRPACPGRLRRGGGGDRRRASARSTSSASTCRTRTPASSRPTRPSGRGLLRRAQRRLRLLRRVPRSILYDNTKLAVARILGDGTRQRTRAFAELQSHYLFLDRFGRPGKGNDKGKVEGLVGYARRNFLVPVPRAASFAALNAQLERRCLERLGDRLRGHEESIGERLVRDLAPCSRGRHRPTTPASRRPGLLAVAGALRPQRLLGADRLRPPRGAGARLRRRGGDRLRGRGHRPASALLRARGLRLRPAALPGAARAQDRRARPGRAAAGWDLPEAFATLRRLLEARMGKRGKREYVQVLRLLETFRPRTCWPAVREALGWGAIGFDAVKHLVLCRIERRPPRLDLTVYPYLPRARWRPPRPRPTWPCSAGPRERHAPGPARASPQGAQAADLPARARQAGPAVRGRGRRPPRYLLRLAELELIERERRMVERRIREARFPAVKSLDSFDFAAIPSLNKMLVLELARGEYIERRENVIALGNSGTGKTHIASGSGLAACQKGCRSASPPRPPWSTSCWRRGTRSGCCACSAAGRLQAADHRRARLCAAVDRPARSCCSRSSASATSAAPPGHQQSAVRRVDRACSGPSGSPARCSTGSPTTSTSWR